MIRHFHFILISLFFLLACSGKKKAGTAGPSEKSKIISSSNGLHGYISYYAPKPPKDYGMGVSFYSAVWPLIDKPLANFQIGLPSTWIIPENGSVDFPLCPEGTLARTWKERGPSWSSVFQTVEGGLGYWAGNRFRYGSPKFSMNGVPSCYDYEVASPGWSFFYSSTALEDDKMGIAQLSNRILVPPDGVTFKGEPNGQFLGYAWMAMPFMDGNSGIAPTGDQSWTLFLNASNFKGPVAYYVAETWTKIAKAYPAATGHTLDVRPGLAGGGAMEINTVPKFELKISEDSIFTKIPALRFPVDSQGRSLLVQDVKFYSKETLYRSFKAWRDNKSYCDGTFNKEGSFEPILNTRKTDFKQDKESLAHIDDLLITEIFPRNVFGIQWKSGPLGSMGKFPQYFLKTGKTDRVPISPMKVPFELRKKEFALAKRGEPYTSPTGGAWKTPGPTSGPIDIKLADGSTVTYRWYRFIDQPSLQQYHWSQEERKKLQSLVERIHSKWLIDHEYMEPPTEGELIKIDPALILNPPKGMEIGYVPIVIGQK